ncbi:MAG: sigma-54 dependent transcriptional regulator, partial [Spirochaetaceae bacterium]|nr:sigma-54 dependent transcriptional regulator [Spirochaetaceae bacterium]
MNSEIRGKGGILIVDDEEGIRFSLGNIFSGEGYRVRTADSRQAALKEASDFMPDAVLLDIRLKGEDGLDVLKDIRKTVPEAVVIMITGYGSIGSSVQAIKEGASDYILKPIDRTAILDAVGKNIELKTLRTENSFLKSELRETRGVQTIDTVVTGVKDVIRVADRVKDTGASILITGESGSGKELLAQYIHYTSIRQERNFIGVNCAALSDSLLLSELFGHEKGSFTGAHEQRPGKFELADGGTLFLDEIGDMSLEIQAKILRVLEERNFERVGGIRSISVDVRVIAATNRDLEEFIREGRFRQDLYYRLKVISCHLPPLRERLDDIPLLVDGFIRK